MKSFFRTLALVAVVGAQAIPQSVLADGQQDTATVVRWDQFNSYLDRRQLKNFTGVSGGYVAFVICSGSWFRVRASVADVVNALNSRGYQSDCRGDQQR